MTLSLFTGADFSSVATPEQESHRLPKEESSEEHVVLSVQEHVEKYFSDIPEMIEVARCESHFTHTTRNGILRGRVNPSDIGVMQINTFYHEKEAQELGLDLYDFRDNMAYARHLYEKKGTQPWNASAPCWSKRIAQN